MNIIDESITWNNFEIDYYSEFIKQKTKINPINVFDIGSSRGWHAEALREKFNISEKNVFCLEANIFNFDRLKKEHPNFNNFNIGVYNITGKKSFKHCRLSPDMSSFLKHTDKAEGDYDEITINISRMDDFIKNNNIETIDICKIDVEGCTFEVLEGFGDKLNIVKSIQPEGEILESFTGQNLFDKDKKLLESKGFIMVGYREFADYVNMPLRQCDSIWIQKEFLK